MEEFVEPDIDARLLHERESLEDENEGLKLMKDLDVREGRGDRWNR